MEADFAAEFQEKLGDARGQWHLTREDEVILLGDTVMIPDFAFTHKRTGGARWWRSSASGTRSICGAKWKRCAPPGGDDLILLVYEGVNLTDENCRMCRARCCTSRTSR